MSTVLCPGVPVPTHRPWPQRMLADLALAWSAWRERALHRRALSALDGLSDSTLKDIGYADIAAERRQSVAAANFLRGL